MCARCLTARWIRCTSIHPLTFTSSSASPSLGSLPNDCLAASTTYSGIQRTVSMMRKQVRKADGVFVGDWNGLNWVMPSDVATDRLGIFCGAWRTTSAGTVVEECHGVWKFSQQFVAHGGEHGVLHSRMGLHNAPSLFCSCHHHSLVAAMDTSHLRNGRPSPGCGWMRAFSSSSLNIGLSPSLCVCKPAWKGWGASAGQRDGGRKMKLN